MVVICLFGNSSYKNSSYKKQHAGEHTIYQYQNIRNWVVPLLPLVRKIWNWQPPPLVKNHILLHSKGSIIGINGCVAQLLNSCIALLQKIVLPWDFAYLGCWVKATTMQKIGSVQTSSLQWVKIHMLEESLMFEIIYACVKYKKKVKIKLFVKICLMCVNILPILHVYSKIIRSIKIYLTQPPAPSCQQKKNTDPPYPPSQKSEIGWLPRPWWLT